MNIVILELVQIILMIGVRMYGMNKAEVIRIELGKVLGDTVKLNFPLVRYLFFVYKNISILCSKCQWASTPLVMDFSMI